VTIWLHTKPDLAGYGIL